MREELFEEGIVIKLENGIAEIKLLGNDTCKECSAKIICKPREDSSRILTIKNTSNVQKGDKVTISILGKNILRAAVNLYFYPLIILIMVIILGLDLFTNSNIVEFYAFLMGILALSIYYILFFVISKRYAERHPLITLSKSN